MRLDPEEMPANGAYKFLTSAIVPRPIAFVSTESVAGVLNVAPFSYFNVMCDAPPILTVAANLRRGEPKDTLRNVIETGEFVINLVDETMLERAVYASGDWAPEVDEFALAGFTAVPSERVRPPRVGESPVSIECRLEQIVSIGNGNLVLGRMVLAHVRDDLISNGIVDPLKMRPVARLGGDGYTTLGEIRRQPRPVVPPPGHVPPAT
jgi:flavin reductase (DIM6/NTAB) family NADH-FMN oxidoreductase RutF